ncbi:MAG TPA: hypothetical protein DEV98_05130 [Clostridiales bacterium]|nr:hypothetical protein [Clostridiales bacterium]
MAKMLKFTYSTALANEKQPEFFTKASAAQPKHLPQSPAQRASERSKIFSLIKYIIFTLLSIDLFKDAFISQKATENVPAQ